MEGEIWDFDDTFNTSDSQSVCSTGKSGDSLVKFRDINIINHNPSKRNIWKLLGRRRRTRNIFVNLSLENNKNNENSKQCDNLQDRNVDKNEPKETNHQSP